MSEKPCPSGVLDDTIIRQTPITDVTMSNPISQSTQDPAVLHIKYNYLTLKKHNLIIQINIHKDILARVDLSKSMHIL